MPSGTDARQRGITCEDCYFRRELVCALEETRVRNNDPDAGTPCPTFRAAVGRRGETPQMAQPRQAALIPVPATLMPAARAITPVAAHVQASVSNQPFSSSAPEATFSLREVTPVIRPIPRRAAAARRASSHVLTLTAGDIDHEGLERPVPAHSKRLERLRARVAERYPLATHGR